MEFDNNQKALLYTLLYSDIFNFPLTEEELWLDLMAPQKVDKNTMRKTVKSLSKFISYKDGFFCLKGKEGIIKKRTESIKITQRKLKNAFLAAPYIACIPTILFIGITGRLSHFDSGINDDIDIFIITKKNTMWGTRLLLLTILEFLNLRRAPYDANPADKICPNLIIEESALVWPPQKHDLYTAHEIVHILPIFVRNNIYKKFLSKNKWVNKFYPHRELNRQQKPLLQKPKQYIIIKTISLIISFPLFEDILENLQKLYMRKKRTNEIILPNFLAFHPVDYRQKILKSFASKIKKYRLLTNL